jgi:imidazolonepropionase-like amidohydrolase
MRALRAPVAFDGDRFVPDGATVFIDRGSIVGVEPFEYDAPSGVEVATYDGTILPGLIDAHVHLVSDAGIGGLERAGMVSDDELDAVITQSLAAQAAAGVTTVRDLGDVGFRTLDHRERATAGFPRIVASGPPLTTPGGHCDYLGGVVDGPEAFRLALAERGCRRRGPGGSDARQRHGRHRAAARATAGDQGDGGTAGPGRAHVLPRADRARRTVPGARPARGQRGGRRCGSADAARQCADRDRGPGGGWLSVDEAVASATSVAAHACGLLDETGRLASGLAADVLVVDGDLSKDVESLCRPRTVLVRGVRVR